MWTLLQWILVAIFVHTTSAQEVTVYTASRPRTITTSLAPSETYTGLPAYDPLQLTAPPAPTPAMTSLPVTMPQNAAAAEASGLSLSKFQKGNFLGFSIELSIADTLFGPSGKQLKPIFLNYMANIRNRAGLGPVIRVGGNSQDTSTIETTDYPAGTVIEKIKTSSDPTDTPLITYTPELLYIMSNITQLLDVEWFFGLAFNETDILDNSPNIPLAAQYAQSILGPSLRGLVVGNEPDLYVDHNERPANWSLQDYMYEFDNVTTNAISVGQLQNQAAFVGPSVCCDRVGFELVDLIDAGWLQENEQHLAAVSVQHYPENNCQIGGVVLNPQDLFPSFLNHTSAIFLTSEYLNDSANVQAAGKELIMLEMNTASCGGFPGLSDSFGAAVWMTDWALQMAYANFSAALMHVGGQNVYYNPFTPPPSNMSDVYEWTTGSVYYSALVVAEALGRSNASQVVDLTPVADVGSFYPYYGIYENDAPARLVLFNYVDDPTGASTYMASIASTASSVTVKYFIAPSVSEQYNITWAGQTMGTSFSSNGVLKGNTTSTTIQCSNGQCTVPVYAPSIAVVFLTQASLEDSGLQTTAQQTYATTVIGSGSATINPSVLETSNGQNGPNGVVGSNGKPTKSGASRVTVWWMGLLLGFIITRTL